MKIVIKEPQAAQDVTDITFDCIFIGVVLFALFWQRNFFLSAQRQTQLLLLIPLVAVLCYLVYVARRAYKTFKKYKRTTYTTALDFQPTAVIVQDRQELALPYEETSLHLRVYITEMHEEKKAVMGVCGVSFTFQTNNTERCLDHETDFKELFSILKEARRFSKFTYDFKLEGLNKKELSKGQLYKNFVEEQIQNQLQYGVHLPFPEDRLPTKWGKFYVFAAILLVCLIAYSGVDLLTWIGGVLLFGAGTWWKKRELSRYYRAKRQLDKYRK